MEIHGADKRIMRNGGAAALVMLLLLLMAGSLGVSANVAPAQDVLTFSDGGADLCESGYGLPNPADVYCSELGYRLEAVKEVGGERSNCIFPDGTVCDTWQFYEGTCGEAYSYCARLGYRQITKTDGADPFSPHYAVCVRRGMEIGSVSDLLGLRQRYSKAISLRENRAAPGSAPGNPAGITQLPATFDWRNHDGIDWMTAVQNQARCGSCWAHSAVGTTEATYNIALNLPNLDLDLSAEFLNSDCPSPNPGSCCGGTHDTALQVIRDSGIPDEDCMPWDAGYYSGKPSCGCFGLGGVCEAACTGLPDSCSHLTCADRCADWADRLVTIDGFHAVGSNVEDIQQAVVDHGPIAVCLAMSGSFDALGVYRCTTCWDLNSDGACETAGVCDLDTSTCTSGLIGWDCDEDWDCREDKNEDGVCNQGDCYINHCVIIVGYDDTNDYWMVKNSWGTGWLSDKPYYDNGYFDVGFDECHIENEPYWVEPGELEHDYPPIADADGPYAADEGAAINFDGSGTYDPDGGVLTFAWTFGDGGTSAVQNPSHTYDDGDFDGTSYDACLTVTDPDALTDIDCTTAVIDNVPATATFNYPSVAIEEGSTFELTLTDPYDPSSADTAAGFEYVFDCGDGWSGWSSENTITCDTADDNGTLHVIGGIRDKDAILPGDNIDYEADVVVVNVAPTATFNYPAEIDEGSAFELSFTDPYDPSSADTAAGFEYAFDCGDGWSGWSSESTITCDTADDNGTLYVKGSIRDKDDDYTDYEADAVVVNVAPTATFNYPTEVGEGSSFELSLTEPYDPSPVDTAAGFEYDFDCGDGYDGWSDSSTATCQTFDNGVLDVAAKIRDKDDGVSEYTGQVTVVNLPPVVSVDIDSQTIQYSDYVCDVTFTATDVAADPLAASTAPDPLYDSLLLTSEGCEVSDDGIWHTCTWTLGGTIDEPEGTYLTTVTIDDGDSGQASADTTVIVEPEDAEIWLGEDNPVAVQVDTPGGDSPEFTLTAYVQETYPDDAVCGPNPGDMHDAGVSLTLVPVGPGGPITTSCTQVGVVGAGYDAVLEVACTFDNVPVNTYWVQATVVGGYYESGIAEDVLVVYDPSLGFTTGGGWFYWPGTTDRTSFGYTMKYNRNLSNIRGNLLLIRHLEDGSIYRLKSNALRGLSIGEFEQNGWTVGWASFAGKCTYIEPGWEEAIGNYRFIVYAEDWNEPGDMDEFWLEVQDKTGAVVPAMSMPRPGAGNSVVLNGGNIVVPHNPD